MKQSLPPLHLLFLMLFFCLPVMKGVGQTLLINENIQSWTNRVSYGNYTQTISAGTVSMTQCIVANNAAATGTCSAGRIQMNASSGIVEFPTLSSIGTAEFHLAAGAADRTVKLQKYNGSTWDDLTTFTGIGTTGAIYTYSVNSGTSIALRLASPSNALYVHDIVITDYITAPTNQAYNISFSNITTTGMQISWTNGNGAKRTVFVKENSGSITNPSDGTTYTASSNWNSKGTQLGTSEYYCVFNGTGNSVTLNNLALNTTYYVQIFEHNGTGASTKYLTSTSTNNPNSESTLCGTNEDFSNLPTDSPGNYLSRSWTGTDNVTWTAEGARTDQTINGKAICFGNSGDRWVTSPTYPNGIGTLTFKYVRAFTGTSARSLEVYVNNEKIGGTITVSPTSDVVVTYSEVINVTGDVVLEIRSTGAAQVKIDDISWTCFTICAAPTTQASSIIFPSTGDNSMTINWTNGNGGRRIVVINIDNSFTDPDDGVSYSADTVYSGSDEQVVYNGSGNSVTVTGLSFNTTYWFQVFEYNCTGNNTLFNTSSSTDNPDNNSTTGLSGIYRSRGSGNWTSNLTWQTYNGSDWGDAFSYPNHIGAVVTIHQPHEITLNESQKVVKDLTIESGGKLFRDHILSLYYLNIKGDITCDGTIGNGSTPDAIGFNLLSGDHTISGNGTFHCFRIRNSNNAGGGNSTLTINMDVNLLWTQTIGGTGSGTNAIYNQRPSSTFHVIINSGKTLRLLNTTGDASIGIAGAGSGTLPASGYYGGGFTVNGTITGNGFAWIGSAFSSSNPKPYITIKNGGLVQLRYLDYGSNNIASGGKFTIENGGKLMLTDAGPSSDAWVNTTEGSILYDIQTGSTIEYSRAGDQNIPGNLFNYHHLIFSGSGTKSFLSNVNITGDFTFGNGAYCNPANYILSLGGNWSNSNETYFNEGTSTVIFNESSQQTLSCPGGEKFYRMTMNGSQLTLNNNVQISDTLTMTTGNIITGSYLLELGANTTNKGTLSYTGGFVLGKMRRWFNGTNTGFSTGLFPLGEVVNYVALNRHFYIQFTSAPLAWGYLDVNFYRDTMGYKGLPIYGIPSVGSCSTFNVTTTNHNGYWIATPQTGALSTGNYTLALTGEDFYQVTNLCQLTLLKRVGNGDWLTDGDHLQPTGTTSNPTVSRSGLTGFSNFGFGGGAPNILPVELISFNATLRNNDVLLEWTTASEINNDRFEIERMHNTDKDFRMVGTIAGSGNSNIENNYSATDLNVPRGILYYRLKQVDYDGKYEYVGMKTVHNIAAHGGLSIVNPYSEHNTLSFSVQNISGNHVAIDLYDITGKLMFSQQFESGESTLHVSIATILPAGFYMVTACDDMSIATIKLFR